MTETQTDIISPQQAVSLYGLFAERIQRTPDSSAYQYFCTEQNAWLTLTWQQAGEHVTKWQSALLKEKLKAGDRVALNLRNSKEWIFFDQAALSLGLVVVPIYPDDRPDNVAFILEDADVQLMLVQSARQWSLIHKSLTDSHVLKRVIIVNDDETLAVSKPAINLNTWLDKTAATLTKANLSSNSLASIIYTSGTTGRPKGVMLSHLNMLSVAHGSLGHLDIFSKDLFLSFLPLSHTLERTAGYYLPMMAGATVAFSRGIPQLADDMQQLQPTALIAVPRIFERIYDRIQGQLAQKSFISRALFKLTVHIGWQRFLERQKRGSWKPTFLLWPLLSKRVVSPVHQRLGGKLRVAVSGGAPLPFYVAKLFIGLELNLLQGYGLTETSPVISANKPDDNVPDSVGVPIRGVTVKIGENNELLVQGPGNMLGYWNNHKATAQTIDSDGWLHTGDQATIDVQSHIFITGRIKDILVLSNGEKVPPADIESTLTSHGLFEQALVIGEGQSHLAAILVIEGEKWHALAQKLGLDPMAKSSLTDKKLHQHLIKLTRDYLHAFPSYARIRKVILTLQPWTIENGCLTPTLKTKRPVVIQQYEKEIQALYNS